jgi:hypothetical protein
MELKSAAGSDHNSDCENNRTAAGWRSRKTKPQTPEISMASTFMRLVGSEVEEKTGAERRIFPRKELQARIQGKRLDHTVPARREPHLNLSLRDLSVGGLSAISQSPVESGERVSVFFPPQGIQRGWDASGRVIRCQPSTFGYRIAVEFDPISIAA